MALAPPPMFSYKHVDPNEPPGDRFDDRAEHLLYMSDFTRKSFCDWVAGMPVRAAVGSDVERLHFVTANELLFPHVSLDNDAKHIGYGTVYIKDESFSRMTAAVLQLAPGDGCVIGTYEAIYEEASKVLRSAPEA